MASASIFRRMSRLLKRREPSLNACRQRFNRKRVPTAQKHSHSGTPFNHLQRHILARLVGQREIRHEKIVDIGILIEQSHSLPFARNAVSTV